MQNSHLNDHLKTHAGGKPYKCSQDDEAFTQKCSLICHIKTHDGENHINAANVIRNYVNVANVIRLSYRVAQWLVCGTKGAHVGGSHDRSQSGADSLARIHTNTSGWHPRPWAEP